MLPQDKVAIQYDRRKTSDLTLDSAPGADNLTDTRQYIAGYNESSEIIYLDTVDGDDANSGLTELLAKNTQGSAETAAGSDKKIRVINDGAILDVNITKPTEVKRGVNAKISDSVSMAGTYTLAGTPSFSGSYITNVEYSEELDLYVAVSNGNKIATSTDGDTWVQRTSPFASGDIVSIAWSPKNSLFLTALNTNVYNNNIATSPDGITWTSYTLPFGATGARSITWIEDLEFYITSVVLNHLTSERGIITSTDGLNWIVRKSSIGSVDAKTFKHSKVAGILLAGLSDGTVISSIDGTEWESPISVSDMVRVNALDWSDSNKLFLAVGADSGVKGVVATSPDGITWTDRTTTLTNWEALDTSWSKELGLFVTVGATAKLETSPDGITWTSQTSGFTSNYVQSVVWSRKQNIFVTVGGGGKIAYSSQTALTVSSEISGFNIDSINYSGSIVLRSCSIPYTVASNALSLSGCSVGGNIDLTNNLSYIEKSLFLGDVSLTCVPVSQNDIDIYLNTIAGKLTINNSSQTLFERIRENIVEGGISASYNVSVTGGNTRGTLTNVLNDAYMTTSDPMFVDTVDYKLQFQSNGYPNNSVMVGRSRFYLNSNGDKRDIGAWSYIEDNISYEYQYSREFTKGDILEGRNLPVNEQDGFDGDVSVYIQPTRNKEILEIVYNQTNWGAIKHIFEYIETLKDMTVSLQIDDDFADVVSTVQADGGQSIGDVFVTIDATPTFNSMSLIIGTERYNVMYATPNLDDTTKLVLDRPLVAAITDNQVITTNQNIGSGEYQYSPTVLRKLRRVDNSVLKGFVESGLVLRFVRKKQ